MRRLTCGGQRRSSHVVAQYDVRKGEKIRVYRREAVEPLDEWLQKGGGGGGGVGWGGVASRLLFPRPVPFDFCSAVY